MQLAILLSALLVLLTHIAIKRRPRYCGFSCLKASGNIRERIVRIEKSIARVNPLSGKGCLEGGVGKKLLREIRIFNRMRIVMPCRRGVPVLYSQYLGRLVLDPRWIYKGEDGFARLLYICAAANAHAHAHDGLVQRQLMKNCLYVFGQKDIIKNTHKLPFKVSGAWANAKKGCPKGGVFGQRRFKYLHNRFIFNSSRLDRPSYTIYEGKKHYIDKHLPVQCFETTQDNFTYFISSDKFKYSLSHTSDTFFAVSKEEAVGIYAPDKVSFGSSICEKGDELNVYVSNTPSPSAPPLLLKGEFLRIYVVTAKTKPEVTSIIGEVKRRRGKLDYLLTAEEAKEVAQIESLYEHAWASRFVKGDNLKDKYSVACKYVPTLFLPTLVYQIERPDDFFAVVDSFKYFRRIVATGNNFNIVFLYSSMNDEVREIIKAFADKEEARALINAGVFLFFIDRIKAKNKAVNFLSLMNELPSNVEGCPKGGVFEVTTHISNSFPITHTVYVRNTLKKPQTSSVHIPLDVDGVCKRQGANMQVTSLKSGKTTNYKLPTGATVIDEFGREVCDSEIVCERVFVQCSVRLAGFEEKVLKIIKGNGGLSRKERKEAFLGSLENVKVSNTALLGRRIVEGTDEKLCNSLKSAIKNFEREVFFALLKREEITSDVYSLLIERVIGIKLLRGKIQLMPCIAITGSFELSFTYKGTPYNFKVTERGSGFSVNYGDAEYKNFLQVAVE